MPRKVLKCTRVVYSLLNAVSVPSAGTIHGYATLWWCASTSCEVNWTVDVIRRQVDRYSIRPVLKHGPRSLTCMQAEQS